jgi:AGZA family xanthine/uracil permease-like MFS transporter
MGWMEKTNRKIAVSAVGRWFQLDGSGHVSQINTPTNRFPS